MTPDTTNTNPLGWDFLRDLCLELLAYQFTAGFDHVLTRKDLPGIGILVLDSDVVGGVVKVSAASSDDEPLEWVYECPHSAFLKTVGHETHA